MINNLKALKHFSSHQVFRCWIHMTALALWQHTWVIDCPNRTANQLLKMDLATMMVRSQDQKKQLAVYLWPNQWKGHEQPNHRSRYWRESETALETRRHMEALRLSSMDRRMVWAQEAISEVSNAFHKAKALNIFMVALGSCPRLSAIRVF